MPYWRPSSIEPLSRSPSQPGSVHMPYWRPSSIEPLSRSPSQQEFQAQGHRRAPSPSVNRTQKPALALQHVAWDTASGFNIDSSRVSSFGVSRDVISSIGGSTREHSRGAITT